MTRSDEVSVVLVSRNRARQLPAVLKALSTNTLRPSEVILADDASTDDTVDTFKRICDELSLEARALEHEPGDVSFRINSMRNAGLRACGCERAVILDADHVAAATNLASHVSMLDAGPDVISAGPRLEYAFPDATGPVNFMWGHEPVGTVQADQHTALPFWGLIPASNMGLRIDLARRIGWFDTDYDGAYGFDDVDFAYRAHKAGAFFAGRFEAHVVHIPHETALGDRSNHRNAELFERKHGIKFAYPRWVEAITQRRNWAERYARMQESPEDPFDLGPAPQAGQDGMRTTRWASTNVGGRFLVKLAVEKLIDRLRRGGRRR